MTIDWRELNEDEQLDWLARYVAGQLTDPEYEALAAEALRDPALFQAMGNLSPLREQLGDPTRVRRYLWRHHRRYWFQQWWEASPAWVLAPALAGVAVAGLGIWFVARTWMLPTCPLDLDQNAPSPPVDLRACGQIALRAPDARLDPSNQNSAASDDTRDTTCTVRVNGTDRSWQARSVRGYLRLTLPARSLSPDSELIIECNGKISRTKLRDFLR